MISPEIFRWGEVTVYSLFLLALAGMAGPLLVMLVFILPLAAVTFIEFWTRLGLYSSFAKAQESPSANRVQRILRRIRLKPSSDFPPQNKRSCGRLI